MVKNYDDVLSYFRTIPACYGRTEFLYQYRASVCWRAIKTLWAGGGNCQWSKMGCMTSFRSSGSNRVCTASIHGSKHWSPAKDLAYWATLHLLVSVTSLFPGVTRSCRCLCFVYYSHYSLHLIHLNHHSSPTNFDSSITHYYDQGWHDIYHWYISLIYIRFFQRKNRKYQCIKKSIQILIKLSMKKFLEYYKYSRSVSY